jgi:hypothetical protein
MNRKLLLQVVFEENTGGMVQIAPIAGFMLTTGPCFLRLSRSVAFTTLCRRYTLCSDALAFAE